MLYPFLCSLLLTQVASILNLKQQLVKGEFQAYYKWWDHLESGIVLLYTRLHYTGHYGKAHTRTGKACPAPQNFHETGMIDTIKENYLISKIGSVAGKQITFGRDCKPFRPQEKLPSSKYQYWGNYVLVYVYSVLCCLFLLLWQLLISPLMSVFKRIWIWVAQYTYSDYIV